MKNLWYSSLSLVTVMSVLSLGLLVSSCVQSKNGVKKNVELSEWTPRIGGCGGVFFYAEEGPLNIEIEKQDLFPSTNPTAMRVILTSPDREVLYDKWIPKSELAAGVDTDPGQLLQLNANVARPGVYALMITAAYDRYGERIRWRFRTNCEKYIIETSRGHKDARHKEPIVLNESGVASDVCFLPKTDAFDIRLTHLDENVKSVELRDAKDRTVALLIVQNDTAAYTVGPGEREAVPWKLHFPKAQATVEIEGVTEWNDDEGTWFFENSHGALWTPHIDSWFSFEKHRWLVTPHNRQMYGQPGEQQSMTFKVYNNGEEAKKVDLSLEFPDKPWTVALSDDEVTIEPNEEKEVRLTWITDGIDRIVHLRASHEEYSTYSTLYANAGDSPVASSIEMPLVLQPYTHEHEQFGYLPDYPLDNQMYFNTNNAPFVRNEDGVSSIHRGQWTDVKTKSAAGSIMAFDKDGDVYTLAKEKGQAFLLHSTDGGKNFTSYAIPGNSSGSSFDMEQFTGHNTPSGPPPITRYTRKKSDKEHFWRRYGDMELLIPKKTDRGIEWEEPVFISEECLGVSSHSGIPSSVVSSGDKIFLCWGEASDPEASQEEIPGVPVFATTYHKTEKRLEEPVLVGFGAPPNDAHNIPGITMDSEGYLHILTGTHGRPFQYSRSLEPETTQRGWTKAEPIMETDGSRSTQTYIGLVTGLDNTLHVVFRLWQYNTEYFPDNYFASLAYMSKKPGEPWSEPQLLVVAPFSHYSLYRHRLTIDREDRLFLSYLYWSTYWFYRNDRQQNQRSLLMSPDGGKSWKMAGDADVGVEQ